MAQVHLNRLLGASLIWVVGAFLIHEIASLDIWWQMRIGEDILENLRVPRNNLYSAGALNNPYHDSHWLFQTVLGLFHRMAAGPNGALLMMVLIWGITLTVLFNDARVTAGFGLAATVTFIAAGACAERFLPRPETVTFLMIVLFYARLRQGKFESRGDLLIMTLLQAAWTNSHGLFVIGPFMVGCYWFEHGIERMRGRENRFGQLSLLLGLVCVAMFITPHGAGAVKYALLLFSEVGQEAPDYMQAVGELSGTFDTAAMSGTAFWFFALLLAMTPLAILANFRVVSIARLLILAGLLLAALTGRRNMVLFAVTTAPFIAENLAPFISRQNRTEAAKTALKVALAVVMLSWSTYPLSGRYYLDLEFPARFGIGTTPDFFPHGLVPFIRKHGIHGQVYNTSRLGGFYLYHFYPEAIPFQDGRWEVYGDNFFLERRAALKSYPAWKAWVEGYNVNSVLLHHTAAESQLLAPGLYSDPEWALVYYDYAASFFIKREALGSAKPITFGPASRSLGGDVRLDSHLILNMFYRNLGQKRLLLENLEHSLDFGESRENTLLEIGNIKLEQNQLAEAEERFLQVLEINTENVDALTQLAFINYQKGQLRQSLIYSEWAVAAEPDNVEQRFNHALILVAMGRKGEAIAQLDLILKQQPDYAKAQQLLNQLRQ